MAHAEIIFVQSTTYTLTCVCLQFYLSLKHVQCQRLKQLGKNVWTSCSLWAQSKLNQQIFSITSNIWTNISPQLFLYLDTKLYSPKIHNYTPTVLSHAPRAATLCTHVCTLFCISTAHAR